MSETKTVYCLQDRENFNNSEQGSLRPIFEETVDGIILADPDVFINNGKIHFTKGYSNNFTSSTRNHLFKLEVNISSAWDENSSHDDISKYTSYDKMLLPIKSLEICQLLDAEFPEPSVSAGLVCSAYRVPEDLFFIKCSNSNNQQVIVGPLDVVQESVHVVDDMYNFKYKAPDKPLPGPWAKLNNIPHSTFVFEYDLIPEGAFLKALGNVYLVNNSNLPFSSAIQLDISTDENLIKWASKLSRKSNSELSGQLPKLRKLIGDMPVDEVLPQDIFVSRKERLMGMPERVSQMEGFFPVLINYLKTEPGEKVIKTYVEAQSDTLLKRYLEEEIENKKEEAQEIIDNDLSELLKEKEELELNVVALQEKHEELKKSARGIELNEIQEKLRLTREELEVTLDFNELTTSKKLLINEIEKLRENKAKADSLLTEIQRNINQSQESHKLNLIELKMGLDAISGNINSEDDLSSNIIRTKSFEKIIDYNKNEKINVLNNVVSALNNNGRNIGFDEVAVLLVATLQNLVVTLAGKPGSGKSSAVNDLANVLGCKERNKYVRIQVQRGWNSDKDLLGFYNKLSHCYEPDRHGLYKMLVGLQEMPVDETFSIALLDEANLSPIEHYWSGFMGVCDEPDSFSLRGIGKSEELSLPAGVRFLATVNYDRTTEPLSERFLDRSPVIYLKSESKQILSDLDYIKDNEIEEVLYSYEDLISLFGTGEEVEFHQDEKRIMEKILDDFNFLDVNYRKIKSIKKFTVSLRDVLGNNDTNDLLKAFDFAILINVVPLINGQGREYIEAVTKFNDFISSQGLIESSNRTSEILKSKQFDACSFFS